VKVVDVTGQGVPAGSTLVELIDRLARELLAQPGLDDVLDRAVQLAQRGIPGACSVSVSLLDKRRRISTVAASNDVARAGDALQYRLGEGPCLDAVWGAELIHSRDLADDPRWPRWGPAVAADLDVHSMLSLQLYTHERTMGSFNIYGGRADAFDPAAVALAGSFAAHAAIAYARTFDRQNLETALVTRNLIGQAQGILMERHKITADRAFEVLVTASQQSNTKLVEMARRVVETGMSPPQAGR
jgi:GAF domain-containing protein